MLVGKEMREMNEERRESREGKILMERCCRGRVEI